MRSTLPAAMQTTLAADALRLVRLVELQFDDATVRYALGPNDVTWNSLTWSATAGAFTELQESAQREAVAATLTLQNLDGVLGRLMDPLVGGDDQRGNRVVIRTVTEADIANSSAVIPLTLVIVDYQMSRGVVSMSLGSPWATAIQCPSRTVQGLRCPWVYKDRQCGSVSTLTTCGKTLEDCKVRFPAGEALRFGGLLGRTRHRRAFFVV